MHLYETIVKSIYIVLQILAILFFSGTSIAGPAHAQSFQAPEVALRARAEIKKNCAACHSGGAINVKSYGDFLNYRNIIDRKYIVANNLKYSYIYRKISGNSPEMPPFYEIQISEEQREELVSAIRAWIEAGAPSWDPQQEISTIDPSVFLGEIEKDLDSESGDLASESRYFTFENIYLNPALLPDLQIYKSALTKLMNSLSWMPNLVIAKEIGSQKIILKVRLSDLGWSKEQWERAANGYPFTSLFDKHPGYQRLRSKTRSQTPFMRADWFIFQASKPPLYERFLQLPQNIGQIQNILGINVRKNIINSQVARMGFNDSGVSQNNRIIERHSSRYGYYWESYDFSNSNDRQNIFIYPIGPEGIESGSASFRHAGGEVIFSLPNGMQAYMLANAFGTAIEKGPLTIVSDPSRQDFAVTNGISCMGCHYQGIIPKQDQIRNSFLGINTSGSRAFSEDLRQRILQLYRSDIENSKVFDLDRKFYSEVSLRLGISVDNPDPVNIVARRYQGSFSYQDLLSELMLADNEETKYSLTSAFATKGTSQQLLNALLAPGGRIKRDTFLEAFNDFAAPSLSKLQIMQKLCKKFNVSEDERRCIERSKTTGIDLLVKAITFDGKDTFEFLNTVFKKKYSVAAIDLCGNYRNAHELIRCFRIVDRFSDKDKAITIAKSIFSESDRNDFLTQQLLRKRGL